MNQCINCADTTGLLKKYRHRSNVTACAIEITKMVGADYSPPVEGCQAPPDGVVFCVPTIFTLTNRLRHQIMQTTRNASSLHVYRLRHQIMQTVGADYSPPVEGCQAPPDRVVFCIPTIFTLTNRHALPNHDFHKQNESMY